MSRNRPAILKAMAEIAEKDEERSLEVIEQLTKVVVAQAKYITATQATNTIHEWEKTEVDYKPMESK